MISNESTINAATENNIVNKIQYTWNLHYKYFTLASYYVINNKLITSHVVH